MNLRFLVPIFVALPILAACGGGSSSSSAASAQEKAIESAEAQAQSAAPSTDAPSEEPSSEAPESDAPATDAPTAAPSSAAAGATTCADQTINGRKVTDVKLIEGATCADLAKVAASPQIGGSEFEWAVDGFHCASATDTMYVCDRDDTDDEVDFTSTP